MSLRMKWTALGMALLLIGCEQQDSVSGSNGLDPEWRDASEIEQSALGFAADREPGDEASAAIGDFLGDRDAPAAPGVSPGEGMSPERAQDAFRASVDSGITGGMCGAGVRAILNGMRPPMPNNVPSSGAHGYTYTESMANSPGWESVECEPEQCPMGTVLVYHSYAGQETAPDSMYPGGNHSRQGGWKYGHVEMVTQNPSGERRYCYGSCSSNPGGTVRGEFATAWVYRGEE